MVAIDCPIAKNALKYPNKKACISLKKKMTYRELNELVESLRGSVNSITSTLVILQPEHKIEDIALYFAALRERKIPLIISPKEPLARIQHYKQSLDAKEIKAVITKKNREKKKLYPINDCSTLILTSGSSSAPKIVALSHGNFYYSYHGAKKRLKLSKKTRYLLTLPLSHISGLSIIYRTFYCGGTLYLKEKKQKLASCIIKDHITHISAIPTQLFSLIENSRLFFPSLQVALIGSSYVTDQLIENSLKKKIPVYFGYALTEGCGTITCDKIISSKEIDCGKPLPFREISIGSDQQVILSGKTLFLGYLDITSKTISHHNPFFTKDVGYLNHKGALEIQGRIDGLIKRAGTFIQVEEIEKAILSCNQVDKGFIVVIKDVLMEHEFYGFVQTKRSLDEIRSELAQMLPIYKIPKKLFYWPTNLSHLDGKIPASIKNELAHLALSSMTSKS